MATSQIAEKFESETFTPTPGASWKTVPLITPGPGEAWKSRFYESRVYSSLAPYKHWFMSIISQGHIYVGRWWCHTLTPMILSLKVATARLAPPFTEFTSPSWIPPSVKLQQDSRSLPFIVYHSSSLFITRTQNLPHVIPPNRTISLWSYIASYEK